MKRYLYWVSAIIQNEGNKKPWFCAMSEGELSFEKAMECIVHLKENHTVLSVWIDMCDEYNVKKTVFHECYINAFGDVM
jgi:hypothetical protein